MGDELDLFYWIDDSASFAHFFAFLDPISITFTSTCCKQFYTWLRTFIHGNSNHQLVHLLVFEPEPEPVLDGE
jgi:hypothetical protein